MNNFEPSRAKGPCQQDICPCLDPGSLPPDVINACSAIHNFFGLSYASYLVVPRSLLQSMPKDWQAKFVMMLSEIDSRLGSFPEEGCYDVRLKDVQGRFIADPLADYRRGRRIISPKAAADIEMVACEHKGCSEKISVDPSHRCVACEGYYCLTHLKNSTWYGGDPANLCFDCEKDQAEPVQY